VQNIEYFELAMRSCDWYSSMPLKSLFRCRCMEQCLHV